MEIILTLLSTIYGLVQNGVKKLKGMVLKIIEETGHLDEDVLTRAMI